MKSAKVHQPLREIVMTEVTSFHHYCDTSRDGINKGWRDGTLSVSKWWAKHHNRFPKLAIVAKNVLCIPATSANCERAFSTLTDVVTKKRNRLHADTTEKITFCKHNLKSNSLL